MTVDPETSIAEALTRMDEAGTGGLVLCSPQGVVAGFLTDGDVRRAVLRGVSLEDPCAVIANRHPITARAPLSPGDALYLMGRHDINHLPVVDESNVLLDVLLRKDLATGAAIHEAARRRLETVRISPETRIVDAIAQLDKAGSGALALCAPDGTLRGLLTDGDLRRAILRGVSLGERSDTIAVSTPITAVHPISTGEALQLMIRREIDQLPVVDAQGRLKDLILRKDILVDTRPGLSAVIMAGGRGTRLMPLTENVPKPMLPVGDRPLLERTIRQLRKSGIRDVSLTTHYLPESIVEHFGDGEAFGVRIAYANEDRPLGTAGGLRLLPRPTEPFVVINGDILTAVSFDKMLDFHRAHDAELTVGVRRYVIDVPFGVVECEDVRVTELREKPSLSLFVNAGIYLLEPSACDYIPEGAYFDMTDLIREMLAGGRTVVSFPVIEYWLDVGRPEDYLRAQEDIRDGSV